MVTYVLISIVLLTLWSVFAWAAQRQAYKCILALAIEFIRMSELVEKLKEELEEMKK